MLFGLDAVGATAAAAAAVLLAERGVSVSEDEFVRPYTARHFGLDG